MPITPDFNQFGSELWEVANVFRDDALHATERLETFSLFLFLKLWDEKALEDEEAEGGKQLPDKNQLIPEVYRFHNWAEDPDGYAKSKGYEDCLEFCKKMFLDLGTRDKVNPRATDVSRLFKDANLQLRYPTTVRSLVSRLKELNLREIMSHGLGEGERYDVFGRAYEYLLQQFGQNKEFAEYFTPRHIVDRMVQIIEPQIGETIYDPACGTGGFIVRAFERVRDQISRKKISAADKERMLRQLKEKHLFGVEHVPLVFKLALMNMILHRDGSSQLQNEDSLSNKAQDIHKSKYDIILANPPFGPTKQERLAQFEFHIKMYEALFIQHMMNALKPGGRAAVVLKEGLLFDSKKMLRKICRRLVEQFEVLGVLSLPNGVFNPYSGAKKRQASLYSAGPLARTMCARRKSGSTEWKAMAGTSAQRAGRSRISILTATLKTWRPFGLTLGGTRRMGGCAPFASLTRTWTTRARSPGGQASKLFARLITTSPPAVIAPTRLPASSMKSLKCSSTGCSTLRRTSRATSKTS
jgi:type I restriction enzyme M protein